ncbi:DNA primase [Erysipelotrichaceae bacterium OttesenSCG-928-M19]|nr:DNA primase [Erysipelotrichaceae bacterium OttesenSCG-928-M19]
MKRIDDKIIEEIREKNDIVEVISNYLPLTKKGKNYVCLCPFHNDSNPSLTISQEKQIYKCFSCDAGGNVITFVQDYEKISFLEALNKLAQNIGLDLELDNNQNNSNSKYNQLSEYYQLNEEANTLFQYLLNEAGNDLTTTYLKNRKIDNDIQTKFQIGYSSSNNVLTNLLKSKNYDLNKAVEIGLLKIKDNEYYDNFQNRITYPIIDLNNKVTGFTCRTITNEEPKFLNSIESKIFNKSSLLYNVNNAKDSIRKSKTVYILEGPNDVIAFNKAKVDNVVCIMGTAFTTEHINVLRQLNVTDIILGFDGDEAGRKATYNAFNTLSKYKFNIRYLDFKDNDPDDYLNKYGYDEFNKVLSYSKSAIEFKIDYEFSLINTNNFTEKKQLVQKLVAELNKVLDNFDKEYYYNYLASISGISFELIESYSSQQRSDYTPNKKNITRKKVVLNDIENASLNILYFMMKDIKYFKVFNTEVQTFLNPYYRKLYNVIAAYYLNSNVFNLADLDKLKIENNIIAALMKISLNYQYDDEVADEVFMDSISTLKTEKYYLDLAQKEEELINISDPLEKAKKSSEILELTMKLNEAKHKKFNK